MKHPLQTYRESKELSQKGLAEILGCSQSLIAHIEGGNRGVTPKHAEAWEEKTGIPRLSLMYPDAYPFPATTAPAIGEPGHAAP